MGLACMGLNHNCQSERMNKWSDEACPQHEREGRDRVEVYTSALQEEERTTWPTCNEIDVLVVMFPLTRWLEVSGTVS